MKKLLLLLCAFMASISGAWALTNLASGKAVSVIYLPGGTVAPSTADLAKVTDGNTGTNVMLPNVGNDIAAIFIDLEGNASTKIGAISIAQDGRHATAYTFYGTNVAPANYATKDELTTAAASWTELASTTNDANAGGDDHIYTKSYAAASNSGFRYIVFVPTAKIYDVSLRQIFVYQYETPVLTSISATAASTNITISETSQITANAYDQFDLPFAATFTYAVTSGSAVTVSSEGLITAVAEGSATVTVTANSTLSTTIDITVTSEFVMPTTRPTAPTDDSENVYAVYSPYYSATTYTATNGGWNGGHDAYTVETIEGYNVLKSTHCGQFGLELPEGKRNVTAYKSLHASIYVGIDYEGTVANDNTKIADISLKAGKWNYIVVDIDGNSMSNLHYLMFNTGAKVGTSPSSQTVVISDIYFSTTAAPNPMVIGPETDGAVAVTGDVTESDITALNAVRASKLDLTGVSSWTATSAIESPNPNQIIVVGCTYTGTNSNPGTITPNITVANTKNVVAYTADYYFTLTPIEITDNNEYQPWIGSINTNYGNNGYTITRTVAADKYVSAYFPTTTTNVTVTNGTIYRIDAVNSTKSEVKFNKAVSVGGGTPFIVHTTGEATITATGSGDLNMGENGGNTAQIEFASGAALFKGNLIVKQGTGAEWGLQSSTNPEFMQIRTGAKIGAFRAYFTGLTAVAGARAFFIDDNGTTSIKKIEDILNHEDVYYNLNGQRVQNPTKGIYILNGKKVIIK